MDCFYDALFPFLYQTVIFYQENQTNLEGYHQTTLLSKNKNLFKIYFLCLLYKMKYKYYPTNSQKLVYECFSSQMVRNDTSARALKA